MSEKWTDGPWHVEVGTGYDDHGTVYVCHPETSCPETVICKFEDYNDEQDRGNAHLIAAAPEMYEALKIMAEVHGNTNVTPTAQAHRENAAARMAISALKKARGES